MSFSIFFRRRGIILLSVLVSSQAFAQSEIDKAQASLSLAQGSIQKLLSEGSISFRSSEAENTFLRAMMQLQNTAQAIANAKAESAVIPVASAMAESDTRRSKLDGFIEEARTIQKILMSYLGNQKMFGFEFRRGQIAVEIGIEGTYAQITRKFPFLRTAVGGVVQIDSRNELVSQFNSLRTEFYGLLVEAANIDAKDGRLKNLAEWGNRTKVIYPGQTFGEEIISISDFWGLKLP